MFSGCHALLANKSFEKSFISSLWLHQAPGQPLPPKERRSCRYARSSNTAMHLDAESPL